MKKVWLMLLLCSASCFAFDSSNFSFAPNCNIVQPWPATDTPTFCNQFSEIAYCQCGASLPINFCKQIGMSGIYKSMLARYGSIPRACVMAEKIEPRVTKATCEAQWNYFLANCKM